MRKAKFATFQRVFRVLNSKSTFPETSRKLAQNVLERKFQHLILDASSLHIAVDETFWREILLRYIHQ